MTDLTMEEAIRDFIFALQDKYKWFNQEELDNTPERIADFYEEWAENQDFKFTMFDEDGHNQLVVARDVDFHSLCSHHLLPFYGKAHIAYLPGKRICGISKLARAVIKAASRPQVQENMTEELADFLMEKLKARFVMVIVEGTHMCMVMRGVKSPHSQITTSAIRYDKTDEAMVQNWKSLKEEAMKLMGL